MPSYTIALTACKPEEADSLAKSLVDSRVCACVNIIKGVASTFRWKGVVEVEDECILVMKTRRELVDELYSVLKRHHSYELPEFVVIPVELGSTEYLCWISENVRLNCDEPGGGS
jgi:periplasmic divalent cation tolerance protein